MQAVNRDADGHCAEYIGGNMSTTTRRIISRKQWDNLIEKGVIELTDTEFGTEYAITISKDVSSHYTPETVRKIEEDDFRLTSITCTPAMYSLYIKEESYDVLVDDELNPFEFNIGYYVPEWMFEDRQDDLVDLYKRYGKYKEE